MDFEFKLNSEDRDYLKLFIRTGKRNSKELGHAYILLALDDGKSQEDILSYYYVSRTTVWRVGDKYGKWGLQEALVNKMQKGQSKKYQKMDEDELIRMTSCIPPDGKKRWTVQLLIEGLGKGNSIKKMNRESVRQILKRRNIILSKNRY